MKLSYQGIQDKQGYAAAQVALPQYDWAKMAEKTAEKVAQRIALLGDGIAGAGGIRHRRGGNVRL